MKLFDFLKKKPRCEALAPVEADLGMTTCERPLDHEGPHDWQLTSEYVENTTTMQCSSY
jgi:hypothetical protein